MSPSRSILVLQMCRMGDTLQTTPLLRGLRREHPDAQITLVLHDQFAATPVPAHLYDRRVAFPHTAIASALAAREDWRIQLLALQAFVRDLAGSPFDIAINLTQSDLSSLLMAAIPAHDRRGPFISPTRARLVGHPWMQYFWAHARARALGCFNLVDLFTWTAGVGCDDGSLEMTVSSGAGRRVEALLAERRLAGRPIIAIQLGASEEAKRWPDDRFAAAVDLLPAELGEVVLVGARAERPLADRFTARTSRRVHDLVGETTLEELGALLGRCRLLVTNDTGTMHVATCVGTRVLDISTGPVFVHETGPYGVGHLVVEPVVDCFPCAAGSSCHHLDCRRALDPSEAAAVARFALEGGDQPRLARSRLLTAHRATSGRLEYWPLGHEAITPDDLLRHYSARVWEETLAAPPSATRARQPLAPRTGVASLAGGDPPVPPELARRVTTALDDLATVAEHASGIARVLPAASPKQQPRLAAAAHRDLERLLVLGETERACYPIVGFLRVEIESSIDTDLRALARGQAAAYASAAARARQLARLLRAGADIPGIPLAAPCQASA